jgi:hypothetical protein
MVVLDLDGWRSKESKLKLYVHTSDWIKDEFPLSAHILGFIVELYVLSVRFSIGISID